MTTATTNSNDVGTRIIAMYQLAVLAAGVELEGIVFGATGTMYGDPFGSPPTFEQCEYLLQPGSGAGASYSSPVVIVPSAALIANDTNYATIVVQKSTNGGTPVTIAGLTTKTSGSGGSGDWVQYGQLQIPLQSGATLVSGDVLMLSVGQVGAGVSVPPSVVLVYAGNMGISPA